MVEWIIVGWGHGKKQFLEDTYDDDAYKISNLAKMSNESTSFNLGFATVAIRVTKS